MENQTQGKDIASNDNQAIIQNNSKELLIRIEDNTYNNTKTSLLA